MGESLRSHGETDLSKLIASINTFLREHPKGEYVVRADEDTFNVIRAQSNPWGEEALLRYEITEEKFVDVGRNEIFYQLRLRRKNA